MHERHAWDSHVIPVASPWCIVGGSLTGKLVSAGQGGLLRVDISFDRKDWRCLWDSRQEKSPNIAISLDDAIAAQRTNAKYHYWLNVQILKFGDSTPEDYRLDDVCIETDVEMNAHASPSLTLGENQVAYADDTKGARQVRITHVWRESSEHTPPSAPTGGAYTDGVLSWKPAAHADGDKIGDHWVEIRADAEMRWPLACDLERVTGDGQPRWQIPPGWLHPGETYYWRVRAKGESGAWSPWSAPLPFVAAQPQAARTPPAP
jgi:hypothetical protein